MTLKDTATQEIHALGGRMTDQRMHILSALETIGGHPTAEEVFQVVKKEHPDINLSTVYRNLRTLEKRGLLSPRWFEESRRQQRFDPAVQADHYHFRCQECGRIVEFKSPEVDRFIDHYAVEHGIEVSSTTFTIYGTCQECQKYLSGDAIRDAAEMPVRDES